MSGSSSFPLTTPDITPSRTSTVLGDNGTQGGDFTVGALLGLIALNDFYAQLMTANDIVEEVEAQFTDYAVVSQDKNKTKLFLTNTTCAVTVPTGMPKGFTVNWILQGPGILTFASAAGAGQTINSADGLKSGGRYAAGTLKVVAPNTWNLSGFTQV